MRLLSTKILSQNFRERILMNQFSLVEKAFIKISFLKNPKIDGIFDRLIFTSQNAVNAVFSSPKIQKMIEGKIIYCVGKKTASLLAENGQKVAKIAQNSLELAHFLIKNHQNESFSYFCGKLRTPDLEEILPVRGMHIKPIEVYTTHLKEHTVKGNFDGILFFSPSGVRGYAQNNGFENVHIFCLGNSTAKEVALHTSQYTVANDPSESQLLLSLKNHITLHEK
tara:strand:- start:421 stop:1092 length:672 start_codon:yes stop_codon:yes gene_type:complete